MNNIYPDWQKLPITDISRDAVERRHKKVGAERGEAYANLGARTLRSVLNYASAKHRQLHHQGLFDFRVADRNPKG